MKKQKSPVKAGHSGSDRRFDVINTVVMVVMLFIFVWPLWFVVIASVSDPNEVWNGNVILFPKGITLASYKALMDYGKIWIGYANTVFYTVVGPLVNLLMTVCAAGRTLSRGIF